MLIDNGFEESMLYERRPLTLSKTEKLVDETKCMELLSSYIHTLHDKHTIALSEDKREFLKE